MTDARSRLDRRAQLLSAARAILGEKGFEATTIAEIVARAGVAQGTFYLYFPSKSALIGALNQELNEHILIAAHEATAQAQTASEVVSSGIRAAFQQLELYRDILNVIHTRISSDQQALDWELHHGAYHQLIADLIRHRQDSGEVACDVNPEICARFIVGLIYNAADDCYIYNSESQHENYITEMIRFVSRALGIAADH